MLFCFSTLFWLTFSLESLESSLELSLESELPLLLVLLSSSSFLSSSSSEESRMILNLTNFQLINNQLCLSIRTIGRLSHSNRCHYSKTFQRQQLIPYCNKLECLSVSHSNTCLIFAGKARKVFIWWSLIRINFPILCCRTLLCVLYHVKQYCSIDVSFLISLKAK